MPGAKREKSQHGYLPTVVDRTLVLTRRCAHPMFMGCPRVAQRDAAPSPGNLLRLTLRPRYRDVNVWAFIAQHVPEMPGRGLHSRSHRNVWIARHRARSGRVRQRRGAKFAKDVIRNRPAATIKRLDPPERTRTQYHDAFDFTSN